MTPIDGLSSGLEAIAAMAFVRRIK